MKRNFILLALALAGAAQARPLEPFRPLAERIRSMSRLAPMPVSIGPEAILNEQAQRGSAAKPSGTGYRLTGWSRRDPGRNQVLDSSNYEYSGSRGSRFVDEHENLQAGMQSGHSNPDRYRNSTDGGPVGMTEVAYRYDAADRVVEEIQRRPLSAGKSELTYDAAGRLQSILESDSTSAGWEPVLRTTFRYNAAGQRVADSAVSLPSGDPATLMHYHYAGAAQPDSTAAYTWDAGCSAWQPDYLMTQSFTSQGQVSVATSYYPDEVLQKLVPGSRFVYSYNSAGLLNSFVTWLYDDGMWLQRFRDVYTYTGTKALYTGKTSAAYDETQGSWNDRYEWTYTLDAQGRWGREYFSSGVGKPMTPENKTTIVYNANGLVAITKTYPYEPMQQDYLVNASEEEHFQYQSFQTTEVTNGKALSLQMYPNPASTNLTLSSGLNIERIEIYNASGARMLSIDVSGKLSVRVDIQSLPVGVYILKALLGEGVVRALRFTKQ